MTDYIRILATLEEEIEAKGYAYASADLEIYSCRGYARPKLTLYYRVTCESEMRSQQFRTHDDEPKFNDLLRRAEDFVATTLPTARESEVAELVRDTERLRDRALALGAGEAFADILTALMKQLASDALPRP